MGIPKNILESKSVQESIARNYENGMTIRKIARALRVRTLKVSSILKKHYGKDTAKLRGARIGISQRGVAKNKTLKSCGIVNLLEPTQWAYIAGIFDGEGHIGLGNKSQNYRMEIAQKRTNLLYWLQFELGCGSVVLSKIENNQFRIYPQRKVFEFLYHIEPFCIVKSDEISKAMRWMAERYGWKRSGL